MAVITKSMVTTDHEVIRRWANVRGGKPAAVVRPERAGEEANICIDFPDNRSNGERGEISWSKWLKQFDAAGLAFLYQEHTANGERSNFHKVVRREKVDEVEAAVGGKGRSASRKSSRRHHEAATPAAPNGGAPDEGMGSGTGPRKIGKKSAAVSRIVTRDKSRN